MLRGPMIPLALALLSFGFSAVAAPPTTAAAPTAPTKSSAPAEHCRDKKTGKFVACPSKPQATRCRDAKGKFVACSK